jgi:hypothetical protein
MERSFRDDMMGKEEGNRSSVGCLGDLHFRGMHPKFRPDHSRRSRLGATRKPANGATEVSEDIMDVSMGWA